MTWRPDLSPYPGSSNLLNVGWLDGTHPFPRGEVDPETVRRLLLLIDHATTQLTRGYHFCELCPDTDPAAGNGEIRVIGGIGNRYAAPVLIGHYVQDHHYLPPREFLDTLHDLAELDVQGTPADVCLSCGTGMSIHAVHRNLMHGPERRPATVVFYCCATCESTYKQVIIQ